MRRICLAITTLVLILAGCAFVQKSVNNAKACLADPTCIEEAQKMRDKGQKVGGLFGGLVPLPSGGAVGSAVVGSLYLIFYLIRDKKKETELESSG